MAAERVATHESKAQEIPDGVQAFKKNIILMPGQWELHDPFLMMAEDWIRAGGGFEDHPHKGFETVTLVLEGEAEHADNRGNKGVLREGDVQVMTAGSGIVHREMPHGPGACHFLQLWLNLPKAHKLTESRYQDVRKAGMPAVRAPGVEARVIMGRSNGVASPTKTFIPVTALDVSLAPGARFVHDLPASHNAFLYVVEGAGQAGADRRPISPGSVLVFGPLKGGGPGPSTISLTAGPSGPLRVFMCDGEPIREPVVQRGPFVMNTGAEIQEALQQCYREAGPFRPIPA
eukprot:tig00020610_g12008.t1